jgi:putative spermidine/putrescine transport system substrate-binding protein
MKRVALIIAVLVALVAIAGYAWFGTDRGGSEKSIVVLSYGGAFEDAQRNAFYAPFERATGVRVQSASYGGEYGHLKGAVEAATRSHQPPPYDVVDLESSALMRGIRDRLFERIDISRINRTDLIPEAINDYGIATDLYSVSLGWNTRAFPTNGPQPQTWADFWDVTRFPGPRSLKRDARFTLEIALLADGVPPNQIYAGGRLDEDRAFRSLDRIKSHVTVWWTSGQQPIQLVSQGEVVMVAAFGARLYAAQHTDGAPVAMTWRNGILDTEYWAIPRGARSIDLAHRFIDFASQAEQQALLPTRLPLGPVNRRAFSLMSPALANNLNTSPSNYETQVLLSSQFWAANEERLQERFNRWLAQP